MKITTGNNNFDVIITGSVITFKNESINFELAENLKYVIEFISDNNIETNEIDFNIVDGSHMLITLTNFNSALGVGNVEPLLLGHLNGRNLYFNFFVDAYGEGDRKLFHYTWYQREIVDNE